MISVNNISMQFGTKPLFENITITLSNKNRYGLIGANGSWKSTLWKFNKRNRCKFGTVSIDKSKRVAKLNQDQYAYEDIMASDCVIMGYERLWEVKKERDHLYMLCQIWQRAKVWELLILKQNLEKWWVYSKVRRRGAFISVGIPITEHEKPMSFIAPGLKLRVLLAQSHLESRYYF